MPSLSRRPAPAQERASAPSPAAPTRAGRGNQAAQERLAAPKAALDAARSASPGGPVPGGEPLAQRLGVDLSGVRAWVGVPMAVNAVTDGADIAFAAADPGPEVVAHELVHVAQAQQVGPGAAAASTEREAEDKGAAAAKGGPVDPVGAPAGPLMMDNTRPPPPSREERSFRRTCGSPAPDNLDRSAFLGRSFVASEGVDTSGHVGRFAGVNPTLRGRLDLVEAELNRQWAQVPADQRTRPDGSPARSVADWVGVRGSHIGWRPDSSGHHRSGSAIDIDAGANPYIAIRQIGADNSVTTGGEEASRLRRQAAGSGAAATTATAVQGQRASAAEVYDRARRFAGAQGQADVSPRHGRETAGQQYDRMRATSDHLQSYLGLVFPTAASRIRRAPVADPNNADRATLIAQITEAAPEATALPRIQAYLTAHPNPAWTLSAADTYVQILRDYESVRIPMQHGAVSTAPGATRNPAAGFLQFTRTFTEVMTGTGSLRWGGTGMGMESGDMMHFDLDGAAEAAPAGVCEAGLQPAATQTGG